jgi:hypothetical protein
MSDSMLRREIKKALDRLPPDRLSSVADYIAFLNRPTLRQEIDTAERDLKAKKGVQWRKVRDDVVLSPSAGPRKPLLNPISEAESSQRSQGGRVV